MMNEENYWENNLKGVAEETSVDYAIRNKTVYGPKE